MSDWSGATRTRTISQAEARTYYKRLYDINDNIKQIQRLDVEDIGRTDIDSINDDQKQLQKANLDQLEELSAQMILDHVKEKSLYEFQELVDALLRAMDYHTPFILPKGKDAV